MIRRGEFLACLVDFLALRDGKRQVEFLPWKIDQHDVKIARKRTGQWHIIIRNFL
jgi:hypothetical protein